MQKLKLDALNRLSTADYKASNKLPLVAVLDNIRSGHNVGAVFRSADALAIERIVLTGICPRPPHKEIHKTAIGATATVEWEYYEDNVKAVKALQSRGYRVLAIEQTDRSIDLRELAIDDQPIAVIFGNEVDGVDETLLPLCDGAIAIEQYGTKHSFNVSVCAGIVLYTISEKMR